MKKLFYSMIVMFCLGLVACSDGEENTSSEKEKEEEVAVEKSNPSSTKTDSVLEENKNETPVNSTKPDGNLLENKNETPVNSDSENVEINKDTIKNYRPTVGMKKTFIEDEGIQSFSEEFPYEKGDYIQRVVKIGEAPVIQVYKWTENKVSLVYEDKTPEDPNKNYLIDFKETDTIETLYSENGADWELINQSETVEVPYGSFSNVYVIKKVTDEVEGAKTIYTYYLAPKVGLIKESFELTGEQGYSAESTLQSVNK